MDLGLRVTENHERAFEQEGMAFDLSLKNFLMAAMGQDC